MARGRVGLGGIGWVGRAVWDGLSEPRTKLSIGCRSIEQGEAGLFLAANKSGGMGRLVLAGPDWDWPARKQIRGVGQAGISKNNENNNNKNLWPSYQLAVGLLIKEDRARRVGLGFLGQLQLFDCQLNSTIKFCQRQSGLRRAENSSRQGNAMMEGFDCGNDTDTAELAVMNLGSSLDIEF
ncbi:hypothetical protein PPACK8108_LOCUS7065 [Phakopsora pachyrhizi]|uniref:Uncharacterized protein n=1 Tax=Phakopsora pachyrhizi TaxID=170000 RepID=A0AAV0AVM9_PHAPC|nr:hypothetical protein PPACK8108_LOCUS7065 [Phakopsora pachyrhizi]